jgi:hypothetical protein
MLNDEDISSLFSRIISNLDVNFMINIIFGRILGIISNNQKVSN